MLSHVTAFHLIRELWKMSAEEITFNPFSAKFGILMTSIIYSSVPTSRRHSITLAQIKNKNSVARFEFIAI